MEAIEYKGYKIEINYDDHYQESPLEWSTPEERGVTYVLHHGRYDLPNELDVDLDDYESWAELAEANKPEGQPVYRFVSWYEHSDVVVRLSESDQIGGWDSGCAGVVYGADLNTLENEFDSWKKYTEGDIYSYTITDEHGDIIDSLCGLYGYDNALEQAQYFIDHEYTPPRASVYAVTAGRLHV